MLVCPFFASTVSFLNMICVEKKVNRVTRLHGEKLLFCYCKCKWFRVELTREKWQRAGIFPFLTLNMMMIMMMLTCIKREKKTLMIKNDEGLLLNYFLEHSFHLIVS